MTVTLDQILIGPRAKVDQEGKYLNQEGKTTGRKIVLSAFLDREEGTGRPVPWPIEPVGQCLDQFTIFYSKTYIFLVFSLLTLRQGL